MTIARIRRLSPASESANWLIFDDSPVEVIMTTTIPMQAMTIAMEAQVLAPLSRPLQILTMKDLRGFSSFSRNCCTSPTASMQRIE